MATGKVNIQLLRLDRLSISPITVTKIPIGNKAIITNDLLYNNIEAEIEEIEGVMIFKVFSEDGMKCQIFEINQKK